jgi:hypothetical protein
MRRLLHAGSFVFVEPHLVEEKRGKTMQATLSRVLRLLVLAQFTLSAPALAFPIYGVQQVQYGVVASGQTAEVLVGTSYDVPLRGYFSVASGAVLDIAGTFEARGDSEGSALTSQGVVINQTTGALDAMDFQNYGQFVNRGVARIGFYQGLTAVTSSSGGFTADVGLTNGDSVDNSGLLTAYGKIDNRGLFNNHGTLSILMNSANAGTFPYSPVLTNFTNSTFTNHATGLLAVSAESVIENQATFVNEGEIRLIGRLLNQRASGAPANGVEFTNSGLATIGYGGAVVNRELFINSGVLEMLGSTFTQHEGRLVNAQTGALSVANDPTTGASSVIQVGYGTTVENEGLISNDGLIDVSGEVFGSGVFQNNAFVYIQSAGSVTSQNLFTNSGALELLGGRFEQIGSGRLVNTSSGVFSVDVDGRTGSRGSFSAARGTSVENDGRITVWGDVFGEGTFVNRGDFEIVSGGTVTANGFQLEQGTLVVDGTLDTYADALGNGGVVQMTGGVLSGTGLINGDVFIGGGLGVATFTPGRSPGAFTVNGDVWFGAGSVLELEIGLDSNSVAVWDSVAATSISFLSGSTVRFLIDPAVGNLAGLSLLTCTVLCSFDPNTIFEFVGGSGSVAFDGSALRFSTGAVPEPSMTALLLAGLAGLVLWPRIGWARRARRGGSRDPFSTMLP